MNESTATQGNLHALSQSQRDALQAVIDANPAALNAVYGFVLATPGFRVQGQALIREPSVVVWVKRKLKPIEVAPGGAAPKTLGQYRVDVRTATPEMQLARLRGAASDAALASNYDNITDDPIDQLFDVHTPILCHVGPDSGWAPLLDFIKGTTNSFDAAIYDFNAPYIAHALCDMSAGRGIKINLNIDSKIREVEANIQDNLAETLGENYARQVIKCGAQHAFPSAYHEKVIVRDGRWIWLSSGNWTTNSQPEIDPVGDPPSAKGMYRRNREYHVILEQAELAEVFSRYLAHDRDAAATAAAAGAEETELLPDVFVPLAALAEEIGDAALAAPDPIAPALLPSTPRAVSVQPVLSPDNYASRIHELVSGAQSRLYLQYSYITWSDRSGDENFRKLLERIGEFSWQEDFDLRVIIDGRTAPEKAAILAENGWNEDCVRSQSPIHNKAIIADGERVLISSQNWSSDGFLRNRDAGLIIHDPEIAAYYETVFLYDWDNRTRSPFSAALSAVVAAPDQPTPAGMVRMRWQDFYGE